MQRSQGEYSTGEAGGDAEPRHAAFDSDRVEVIVELDADVVAKLKALGPDWQEKVNTILKMAKI